MWSTTDRSPPLLYAEAWNQIFSPMLMEKALRLQSLVARCSFLVQRNHTRTRPKPLFFCFCFCRTPHGKASWQLHRKEGAHPFANQVLLLLADVYLILFSFILHNFAFPPEEIIVSILVKSLCMSAYPCLLGRFYYTLLALWDVNSGWFCIEIGYQACQVPKINKSKELCYFKKEGGERK